MNQQMIIYKTKIVSTGLYQMISKMNIRSKNSCKIYMKPNQRNMRIKLFKKKWKK